MTLSSAYTELFIRGKSPGECPGGGMSGYRKLSPIVHQKYIIVQIYLHMYVCMLKRYYIDNPRKSQQTLQRCLKRYFKNFCTANFWRAYWILRRFLLNPSLVHSRCTWLTTKQRLNAKPFSSVQKILNRVITSKIDSSITEYLSVHLSCAPAAPRRRRRQFVSAADTIF